MEEEHKLASKRNLQVLLDKISKYKEVYNEFEVALALKGLCAYHCVRQTNIAQVLKDGEARIKNEIILAEMTNNQNDYFQGFDNHLSMSLGRPWTEYGPYCFIFGLEDLSQDALVFFRDPWQMGNHNLENNFMIKEDFETFAKEILKRNLWFVSRNIVIKRPFKGDLHALAAFNFRKFEVKQSQSLKIDKAVEFVVWAKADYALEGFVRIFFKWYFIAAFIFLIIMKTMMM